MLSELPAEEEAVVNATGSLLKSLGQWRNSGAFGNFRYELTPETDHAPLRRLPEE